MTEATARLVVCTTCRHSADEPVDADGVSGGRLLLQAVAKFIRDFYFMVRGETLD